MWRFKTRPISSGARRAADAGDPASLLPQDATGLLLKWRWNSRTANVAHLRATDSLTWRNFALGGTSAALGALVGLGVFATLQSSHVPLGVRIAAGATAFVAASSAALWKYLNYSARIELHRTASRSYGNMVRQLDDTLALAHASGRAPAEETVEHLRKTLDGIDVAAPNVPPGIWIWAVGGVAKEQRDPTIDASTIDRGLSSRLRRLGRRVFG